MTGIRPYNYNIMESPFISTVPLAMIFKRCKRESCVLVDVFSWRVWVDYGSLFSVDECVMDVSRVKVAPPILDTGTVAFCIWVALQK